MAILRICLATVVCLYALMAGQVWAQNKLHGNAGEAQAVGEMRGRLKAALVNGDLRACKREGDNMARYGQADGGRTLIDADIVAVDRRLREVGALFDEFRQIHDLNAQKAVEKAYSLIRVIAAKLATDTVTEVTVTLITAPVPGVGRVVTQMGKHAYDFLDNFNDARQVVNRARALRTLDAMAVYARAQMQSLKPAMREAQASRTLLEQCRQHYETGVKEAAAGGSQSAAGAATAGWAGNWQSDYGTLSLQQNGSRITGNYPHHNGRIDASAGGKSLSGRWIESDNEGTFTFLMADDGRSFSGNWVQVKPTPAPGGAWNGRRLSVDGNVAKGSSLASPAPAVTGAAISPATMAQPAIRPPVSGVGNTIPDVPAASGNSPQTASTPATPPCSSPQKASDSWNGANCSLTNRLAFSLNAPFKLSRLDLWSDKGRAGSRLSGQLIGPNGNQTLHARRGNCQGNWCEEIIEINQVLPTGNYRFETASDSLCQNTGSGGNAFVRIYGCRP